mgnify:CR=1 FL=1
MPPSTSPQDPHAVLGVAPGADRATLTAAYYTRLRAVHPSLHPQGGRWQWVARVEAAYQQLWPHAPEHAPAQPLRPQPFAQPQQAPAAQEAEAPPSPAERRAQRRALLREMAFHATMVALFVALLMLFLYLTPEPPPRPPAQPPLQGW